MPAGVNPNDPWLPPDPVPLGRQFTPIDVFRVVPGTPDTLEPMTSLRCLWIEEREGPIPASALFRYAFDGVDPDSPQSIEEALSTASTLTKLIEIGDRIAVRATMPDNTTQWIFDGIPMSWQFVLKNDTEMAIVSCVSRFFRSWDAPIGGAIMRNSDAPETVADVDTDIVAQFNPRGQFNACPSNAEAGISPYKYPTFLDPLKTGVDATSTAYPRNWTLPMAVAYLLFNYNLSGIISHPDRTELDDLLVSREPIPGTPWDPTNSGSYNAKDIMAPDTPITGRSWPACVHDLIKDNGFGMRVDLSADADGNPVENLVLFLKQGAPPKPLYLPAYGSALDPAICNVGEAGMGRDLSQVVNQWSLRGAPLRYEFSCILAPSYASQATDSATDSAIMAFSLDVADPTASVSDKYRIWVLDEGGDGHFANGSTTLISNTATSMDNVFGPPVSSTPQYVKRRRIPIGKLITTDDSGRPLNARLEIANSGAPSAYPAVALESGLTWQNIEHGWKLLSDRIGIEITVQDPNEWHIGDSLNGPYPEGVVKVVEAIGNSSASEPAFYLRLTVCVEGDLALNYTATREITSPVTYPIEREIDARDRIFKYTIAANSVFNTTGTAVVKRDDTELAKAEAIACRIAADSGVFGGDVTIPRFTAFYAIGDRISGIVGRNLGFRTDSGGADFAAVYPMVVSRRWDFDGRQETSIELSDAGLDRRQYSRKAPTGYGESKQKHDAEFYRQVSLRAAEIQKAGFGVSLNSNLSANGR